MIEPTYKLVAAAIIFLVALGAGLLPLRLKEKLQVGRCLAGSGQFAKGVFLGAGLIHLLPDAENNFANLALNSHYPYPVTICALTLFMLLLLEQGIIQHQAKKSTQVETFLPLLLIGILSIHAVIAGAALGVSVTFAGLLIIFLAIIAHKGAESFALSINFLQAGFQSHRIKRLVFIFSLMTPMGIFLGALLDYLLETHTGLLAKGIFDAVAAGTFLYIATLHHYQTEAGGRLISLGQVGYFGLGILTMAIVAIWL